MWHVVWFIAFIAHEGDFRSNKLESVDTFSSEQECHEYIDNYKDRMPDFVRGFENLDFTNVVRVAGLCEYTKDPT